MHIGILQEDLLDRLSGIVVQNMTTALPTPKHVKDRLHKAIPFDLLVLRSILSRKLVDEPAGFHII